MTPIDYQALRSGTTAHPPDGAHVAVLNRAKLVDTSNGERLVTEWQTQDDAHYWDSWNRFDGTGISYTQELLQGLGIDLAAVKDDDSLTEQLSRVEGGVFEVRTQSNQGSQGDRWFTNTYVDARAGELVPQDVPIDTGGLPEVGDDDETIPF